MTPRATYRLQFQAGFGFDAAAAVAPYLAALGISHVYASPYLKARPGSLHGYDIVDHSQLNPELGDETAFARFCGALNAHGLGQILDYVPNHMGVGGADNPLWLNVLEWGADSAYAGWFDIEWDPDRRYLHDKVLVPMLGDQYGLELERGRLALQFDAEAGSFAVWAYGTHKLPVCPTQYAAILGTRHAELERLGDAFSWLESWRGQIERRADELKLQLARLVASRQDVREALDLELTRYLGREQDADSWRELEQLVSTQHWRIAHFRVAADDINYRRFFNINDLAGLRMELPDVFEHAHRRVLQWLADGTLDGLRIDHIDGLRDPKGYLVRLRQQLQNSVRAEPAYLIVEKILAPHERLRSDWPVDGTTGYEFANMTLGLLIDPAGEAPLSRLYAEFAGPQPRLPELIRECKLRIMNNEMASELNVLGRDAARLARQNPRTADFTRNLLQRALRELIACYPVYRTYIDADEPPDDNDRRDIDWALAQARRNETELDPSVFDFLQHLLDGTLSQPHSGFSREAVLRCVQRLQQYSGPVMAKGLEDTAFYRYNRLITLNEVGGAPERFGVSVAAFHKAQMVRAASWPQSMLCSSTHDTKRGEDARARLAVLSELPEDWSRVVQTCSRILRGPAAAPDQVLRPDCNDEYLLYQTLLGSWPVELLDPASAPVGAMKEFTERVKRTFIKSIREARVHSNWSFPDSGYEDSALALVDTALLTTRAASFLPAFVPFVARIAALGAHNTLIQTVLKLTVAGVPDIYQGAELWDLSMVDPDNRRAIDYGLRLRHLQSIDAAFAADRPGHMRQLWNQWHSGEFKLAAISTLLRCRRDYASLFASADHTPLATLGTGSEYICAFARRGTGATLVVAVARWPARSAERDWGSDDGVALPDALQGRAWQDLLTGRNWPATQTLQARRLFADLPAAVLLSEDGDAEKPLTQAR